MTFTMVYQAHSQGFGRTALSNKRSTILQERSTICKENKAVVGGPAGPAMAGLVLGHNKKFQMCSNLLQVSN